MSLINSKVLRVGGSAILNQDNCPGLGDWWTPVRDGETVLARVYADDPHLSRARAAVVVAALMERDAPRQPTTTLTWQAPAQAMPDADESVLVWFRWRSEKPADWGSGWFDGELWRLSESGGIIDGHVLYWARPVGPGEAA
jgi:hypothetical protein